MRFICQQEAMSQLQELSDHDRHSVLIEGVPGCGKTYLARQYANMLGIPDFQVIDSTVGAVRDAIDACYRISNPIVLCIENLDNGVAAASYALLKFLEEPAPHVYLVVTCQNINNVPDTIVSRSVCVITSPPIDKDIEVYASDKNFERYYQLHQTPLWRCVHTFKYADMVLKMTDEQVDYFAKLSEVLQFKDTVSNISWRLGHYPDNTDTPIELVISYLIEMSTSPHVKQAGIQCIKEINQGRIATHASIAKFIFESKYKE